MSSVAPNVTEQAASPAHSETSKNASRPDCSPYMTANSAAEQIKYRSIGNAPMSGDDAKAADGGKTLSASPGAGNMRRPTITLPARPHTRPLSAGSDLSYRRLAELRVAPMGSLYSMRGHSRRTGH